MFENTIVNKPWGYEYQVLENDNVSLWYLKINYNHRTSLHAHPNKKTGLIVLSGVAEISFLNHKFTLAPPDKTMIRQGVFHSTRAKSKQGLEVLEIETPVDKLDLVRLEDYYGRAGKPYEDSSHFNNQSNISTLNNSSQIQLGDCILKKERELLLNRFHTIIILDGGIQYKHHPVLSYGDIVDNSTLVRLSEKFDTYPSKIIGIEY
jgi:mannose-6-phosphate isomerase-like protein (cupin superfamily)